MATWEPSRDLAPHLDALFRILKSQARGRENVLTKGRLMPMLAARGLPLDSREYDWCTMTLRNDPRFEVVTAGAGIFWAIRLEEIMSARQYITSRFDDLRTAAAAYDQKIRRWRRGPGPRPAAPAKQGILFDATMEKT